MNRREALFSMGAFIAGVPAIAKSVEAKEIRGFPVEITLSEDSVPRHVRVGGELRVFKDEIDRKTLTAIIDRLIPSDDHGPSASEASCLEFIDDQLATAYGSSDALYLKEPLKPENEEEIMGSPQFIATPRERYEIGLKALQAYVQKTDGAPSPPFRLIASTKS